MKIAALQQVERPLSRLRRDVLPGRQDLLTRDSRSAQIKIAAL
jgi:hypothetical protein